MPVRLTSVALLFFLDSIPELPVRLTSVAFPFLSELMELRQTSAAFLFLWNNASAPDFCGVFLFCNEESEGGQTPTQNQCRPRSLVKYPAKSFKRARRHHFISASAFNLCTNSLPTMSGPRTKWEDLSNLGWFKQQVYDRLNSVRGGTMQGLGDIALNEGFATDFGYATLRNQALRPQRQTDALLHVVGTAITYYTVIPVSMVSPPTTLTALPSCGPTTTLEIPNRSGLPNGLRFGRTASQRVFQSLLMVC